MKGNSKRTSGNSSSPLVTDNRVIGASLQMLLTQVKLRLRSRLYRTSFPKSLSGNFRKPVGFFCYLKISLSYLGQIQHFVANLLFRS